MLSIIPKSRSFAVLFAVFVFATATAVATAAAAEQPVPLARGGGISQDDFDAYAEAHGRLTLSSWFDAQRPGAEFDSKLKRSLERAQELWLSGSIDAARSVFKDIARLTLDADWRQAQRESIHYAYLRLAQSSATAVERDEWLQRSVEAFPDIRPDDTLFPPPVLEAFTQVKERLMKLAKEYALAERFAGYRWVLVNGRKYDLNAVAKAKLPSATFRITALGDDRLPLTEKVAASSLELFRVATASSFSGSCASPSGGDSLMQEARLKELDVLFAQDCVRSRTLASWRAQNNDLADVERSSDSMLKPSGAGMQVPFPEEPKPLIKKRTWIWIGLSAVVAGSAYLLYRELNKPSSAAPEPQYEPVHSAQ